MLGRPYQIASYSSDFYRYKFYKMLRWLYVFLFIAFILIACIFYLIFNQSKPPFYANSTDGRIMYMPPYRTS